METDYIIIGAGSAGCALAYRISAAGKDVIVVEHGGTDAGPFIQMPGALSYPMNMPRYDWGYKTQPEAALGGRIMTCPRGKVIGGTSSINGMIYVRGHRQDYMAWERLGAKGWGYADVLPYFKRMECWHGADDGGDPRWRGHDGPLHITRSHLVRRQGENPLVRAFLEAGIEAGHGMTPDYNGARQEGVCAGESTIWQGRRWSCARAYLHPALRLPNCRLIRGLVDRIEVRDQRARGIGVRLPGGRHQTIRVRREVILAAGAINSPLILLQSGIGPGDHLAQHGIEVIADRPGVGANLQDHLELYIQTAINEPLSLFRYWSLAGKARVGLEWLLFRTGPGASNHFEALAFLRSGPTADYPDVQFHFLPIALRYDGKATPEGHGFQIHTGPARSKSRGTVRLGQGASPDIRFNYMSCESDWQEFRTAIRMVRTLTAQPSLARLTRHEIQPGTSAVNDADLDATIREHAESAYHPCGTCRMGSREDPMAVVDPETRVIGIDALRVADSSIFPQITNGNTNAPSILVGEKAADHILERPLLSREDPTLEGEMGPQTTA